MTTLLTVRNVNHAWGAVSGLLAQDAQQTETRNGPVWRLPQPVITTYERPTERVLFCPIRDANPFFHFFESLWILHGRNDVLFLRYLNRNIADYSDDGRTFHGAYGARLRWAFGVDQLVHAVRMLQHNPKDRRVVCSIWHPQWDLGADSKDIPCNDMLKFDAALGALQLTVFNRSNDVRWGAYGANAVQFSVIQEYVAACTGLPVGPLHQVSTDWHHYGAVLPEATPVRMDYETGDVAPWPLLVEYEDPKRLDLGLRRFFIWAEAYARDPSMAFVSKRQLFFFRRVAEPLWRAWCAWKRTDYYGQPKSRDPELALSCAALCAASDWRTAATEWLTRRLYPET